MNMGIMQMATMVITPTDKNLPLFSADYIYILNNRKCYVEFYDVVQEKDEQYHQLMTELAGVKEKYGSLEDMETSTVWYDHLLTVASYKTGKSAEDKELEALLEDSVKVYVGHSVPLAPLSEEEKAVKHQITLEYTDGLIEKGGISTDVFKDALGEKETKKFFDKVFFGTNRN